MAALQGHRLPKLMVRVRFPSPAPPRPLLTTGRDRTSCVGGEQGGAMAEHEDAEFVMSQVKLAAAYKMPCIGSWTR